MARKHSKYDSYDDTDRAEAAPAVVPPCWPCGRPTGTNSELQRHGMDVQGLLDNPAVRKFVDWVAKKEPDFTATLTKKQR